MNHEVNIGTGKVAGMFYHAPLSGGTAPTMPTSPFDTLATPWAEVGYVSEDGPFWTPYGSTEKIRAWSRETVRQFDTEKGKVTVPVISTTEESLKTVFGTDHVTTTEATAQHGNITKVTTAGGPSSEKEAFVLIGDDGDDGLMLLCESGMVTEVDEIGFAPGGAIVWGITIEGDWSFIKDDGQVVGE